MKLFSADTENEKTEELVSSTPLLQGVRELSSNKVAESHNIIPSIPEVTVSASQVYSGEDTDNDVSDTTSPTPDSTSKVDKEMSEESESCVTNSDSSDSGITVLISPRVSRIKTNPKQNISNVDIKITEPKETRPESLDRLLLPCVPTSTDPDHSYTIDSTNNKHSTGENVAVQRFKENVKESRRVPTRTIATATGQLT